MKQFQSLLKENILSVEPLAQAGSNRQYFRITLSDSRTLIGVAGTSYEENNAFITMSRHFVSQGLNVPKIIAVSADGMVYVQTDLGSMALFDAIAEGRSKGGEYNDTEIALMATTIRALAHFQVSASRGFDYGVCYPQPEFDERNVMFDLNYFKYCFLKPSGVDFHEVRLDDEFIRFAADIVENSGFRAFMIRDFQSRNVMMCDNSTPYFIDYQGGRRGPVLYDVVSFLWQASAKISSSLRNQLIDVYLCALQKEIPVENMPERRMLPKLVLFRTLQVLGAYGYRGYFERKAHFLSSIPAALDNLKEAIVCLADDYAYLRLVLSNLILKHQ